MPETPSIIVRWDDYSKGDYGRLGGENASKGSFKAKNMIRYVDGYLGPRHGVKNVTPASMPDGVLLALQATPVPARDGMFIIGDTVYRFNLNTPATAPTSVGTLDETPDQPVLPKLETGTHLVTVRTDPNMPDKTYRIDYAADTVTPIDGSPGGHDLAIYGQQLLVASSEFSPELQGSSPTDLNDFSDGRAALVGDNWQITSLQTLRNGVAILKRTGLWFMTGLLGDPDTEVFRQISSSDGPLHPWQAEKDDADVVWFWPLFRRYPGYFDSTGVKYLGYLALTAREDDATIAVPPLKRGVAVLDGDLDASTVVFVQAGAAAEAFIRHNGVWTYHEFSADVSGMIAANGQQLVLTDGGAAEDPAKIFVTQFDYNRPAFVSDTLTGPGDDSLVPLSAYYSLPHYWSPAGRQATVRQVVVEFKSWNTGTAETNHFDVSLRVMGDELTDEIVYACGSFDQAVGSSSASGTRRRRIFNVQVKPGAAFEVSFLNVRGVAFGPVTVLGEKHDESPAA